MSALTLPQIKAAAKAQLALDYCCKAEEFGAARTIFTVNTRPRGRRVYRSHDCFLKVVCFEGTAVFCGDEAMLPVLRSRFGDADPAWLFKLPTLRALDRMLNAYGHELADAHHAYLPRPALPALPAAGLRVLEPAELECFRGDSRFGEAFAFDETHPDVLAVVAEENGAVVGAAGASADSDTLWQIGIDVLPAHRGRGLASALTAALAREIMARGRVPFYSTVESHQFSKTVAINAGFAPAWAERYTRPLA